jgi:hypothetical protein
LAILSDFAGWIRKRRYLLLCSSGKCLKGLRDPVGTKSGLPRAIPDLAACARSRVPLLNLGLRLLGVPTTSVLRNPAGRADMLKGARGRRRMVMTGSDPALKEVNSAILGEHSFFRRPGE